ncbi:LuxQ periplasmic sensor domain-containing protein [Balneatrix alpica]|uniref:LuxQ periplasmic sensor domain-containing protein n=1 Tax=Balneatrix alpica TaxID=75684 RepID=UPI002738C80B|nr:LuxQ periplasmic sensor domain-containing protein [Balneatrix alpica]
MKRYPLFSFWLVALLLLSGLATALIYGLSYQSGLNLIQDESAKAFHQFRTLSQYMFDRHLERLGQRLTQFSQEPSLGLLPDQVSNQELDQLYYQKYRMEFDLLIIEHLPGERWIDLSSPLYDMRPFYPQLREHLPNRWQLIHHPEQNWHGLLLSKPIINPNSGQVMGRLLGGIVLNDSFVLINTLKGTATEDTLALTLFQDSQALISSTSDDSPYVNSLSQHLPLSGRVGEQGGSLIFHTPILLQGEDQGLSLGSLRSSASLDAFRSNLSSILFSTILVILMLSALIAVLASKLSVAPLQELLRLAERPSADAERTFHHPIREFDSLGKILLGLIVQLQQRETDLLALNQDLDLARQRAKQLSQQLIMLQEQERKMLASELHDELGQCLTAVSSDAYLIKTRAEEGSLLQQCADSIYNTSKLMYDTVYNLIRSLRPLPLDEFGLIEALVNMPILDTLQQKNVQFFFDLAEQEELDQLDERSTTALYRIIQEALNNVAKHAQASSVELHLHFNDQHELQLRLQDNGKGFNVAAAEQGYGLLGIRERVDALNGSLRLESSIKGTCLEVRIPVPAVAPLPNPATSANNYA